MWTSKRRTSRKRCPRKRSPLTAEMHGETVRDVICVFFLCIQGLCIADERWLDWLDSKIALLLDRNSVDPRDYGGKHYDESVRSHT